MFKNINCPPARTSGFYLTSTDFNDYLTLRYYLSEWGVCEDGSN